MITMLEIAIAAVALAWFVLVVAMGVFYARIDREQREMARIREKIDFNEKSIKKISLFFIAIKGEQGTA
jgi:hypothetical protein